MKFRGQRKDNGEVVRGWYVFGYSEKLHYIVSESVTIHHLRQNNFRPTIIDLIEISPESLAMETTILDKNKKMIFGSFPVDGVMSKGGDIYKRKNGEIGDVVFDGGCFMVLRKYRKGLEYINWPTDYFDEGEIIGNQQDE